MKIISDIRLYKYSKIADNCEKFMNFKILFDK